MDTPIIDGAEAAGKSGLSAARNAIQARLAELDDRIAAIRTQLAAADLERQSSGQRIDASWFHRAKTALRHLKRERGELVQRLARLPKRKETLKDSLIAVLREDYDEALWASRLDEAHRRLAEVR